MVGQCQLGTCSELGHGMAATGEDAPDTQDLLKVSVMEGWLRFLGFL